VLLSLWIVMLFSMMQVRRTLGPLESLQEGTRLIGSQRFDSRVEVHSGDEFEALATSFNSMAATLGRQFDTLKTINEINQAIFASLDRDAIVDGVLSQMSRLFAVKWFGVCMFDDKAAVWTRFHHAGRNEMRTAMSRMPATDWLQLQNNPEAFLVASGQRIPEYLQPLQQAGATSHGQLTARYREDWNTAGDSGQTGQADVRGNEDHAGPRAHWRPDSGAGAGPEAGSADRGATSRMVQWQRLSGGSCGGGDHTARADCGGCGLL
jgi:hypothetical protein